MGRIIRLLVLLVLVLVIGTAFLLVYVLHLPLQWIKDQLMAAMEWLLTEPFGNLDNLFK